MKNIINFVFISRNKNHFFEKNNLICLVATIYIAFFITKLPLSFDTYFLRPLNFFEKLFIISFQLKPFLDFFL